MNKKISVLMLCSLLLVILVGTVRAGNPDYSIIEYGAVEAATIDGTWTTEDEWTDAPFVDMTGTATGQFGYNMDFNTYNVEWIVEIFTDDTEDAEDYWQICFDDANSGGSAPDSGDFMIEIVGHTTLTVYQGTGSGWTEVAAEGEITWADSIDSSPLESNPHWILEIIEADKTSGSVTIANPPPTGLRVVAYDASTDTIAAWAPDGSEDDPDSWGLVSGYSMDPIPEGLTFGVMAALSSIALLAGTQYLRKHSKKQTQ